MLDSALSPKRPVPRIAIVGATGAVGRELLQIIEERKVAVNITKLMASERSAGQRIQFRGQEITIEAMTQASFGDVDIAFFSAGSGVSRAHARRAAGEGALVIDNTNAFRMEQDVPLIVPQVNALTLATRPASGIIANPNCSTIPIVRLLAPLVAAFGLEQVVASTYQAASGAGLTGIDELHRSCSEILAPVAVAAPPVSDRFPVPLGFNVIPLIDNLLDDGFTVEEQKMLHESRKILDLPDIRITATCVRVPVVNCHSAAVYVRCRRSVEIETLEQLWNLAPDVVVYRKGTFPSPRLIARSDRVHVGRIRRDVLDPQAFWFWVVSDNVRVGAALNAVQIVEHLLDHAPFSLVNNTGAEFVS